jgi:hypothetical protein
LKGFYEKWNANGAKNIQVVIASHDSDMNGFNQTIEGMPWVALPYDKSAYGPMEAVIANTGFPTPGVINGTTGAVIEPDAFGKVNDDNY